MKKKTQAYDRSCSYNSHNSSGVVTLLSYFSKGKSQSDSLLYREYIADAKTQNTWRLLSLYSMKIRYWLKIFGEYVIR